MGLRQPCCVQMASKSGGVQPLPCPRAFTMALTGGAMEPGSSHTFDAFRLEPPPGGLWRDDVRLALRPRSLAVLRYLVAHAGRLVTKAELRQHVWGGSHVSDTVLRVCVQEIRATLGDVAAAPQYLETVTQQGYQFRVASDTDEPSPGMAGPIVGRQADVE